MGVPFSGMSEVAECPVCFKEEPDHVLIPCRHRLCGSCAHRLNKCPLCRAAICQNSVIQLRQVPKLKRLCAVRVASQLQLLLRRADLSQVTPAAKRAIFSEVRNKLLLHGPAFRSLVCGGQMTQLNLSHATNLTAEDIGAIRSHVALCTTINLSCCDQLDDGALLLLLSTDLPALTSLNCSQTELAGNALVEHACHVPNLLHLSVANTRTFTTAAVSALGRHCPSLTSLDLTNCTKLGDAALEATQGGCIQKLAIGGCRRLSLEAITACLQHCKALHTLDVSNCKFAPDEFMRVAAQSGLARTCSHLTSMGFARIPDVSNAVKFLIIGALDSNYEELKLAGKDR